MRHPLLAAAALASLATVAGCAKQSSRPFAEVDRARYDSTESAAASRAAPADHATDPTVPLSERVTPLTRPTVTEAPPPSTRVVTDPQGRPVATTVAVVPSTEPRLPVAPSLVSHLKPIQLQVTPDGQLLRPWPESVSYRPSGDVLAGPTYWPTTNGASRRDGLTNVYMEPAEFLVNLVLLPFCAIIEHPQTPVIYSPVNRVGGEP